jgi:hypothetical protein
MPRLHYIATILVVAICGLAHPAAAEPEKLEDTIASMRSNLLMAIMMKDVDQLEEWSKTYRTTRSRAPDGYWHLHHFHKILSELPVGKDRMDSIENWEELTKLWQVSHPSSPTPAVVLAGRYYAEAWAARGSGSAGEVFDDAWKVYRSNLDKARLILLEAKPGAVADPEWFARMAQIGLSLSDRKARFMAVIEEGLKREPTYYKLYNVAFAFLLPQWYGSADESDAFARTATERTRDTEGESLYARIYASHLRSGSANASMVIQDSAIDWPRMKRSIDDLLTRDAEPEIAMPLMGLACAAGDTEQAKEIWKHLGVRFEAYRHLPNGTKMCGGQPAVVRQPPPQPKSEPEIEVKARTAQPRSIIFNPRQFGPDQFISN